MANDTHIEINWRLGETKADKEGKPSKVYKYEAGSLNGQGFQATVYVSKDWLEGRAPEQVIGTLPFHLRQAVEDALTEKRIQERANAMIEKALRDAGHEVVHLADGTPTIAPAVNTRPAKSK